MTLQESNVGGILIVECAVGAALDVGTGVGTDQGVAGGGTTGAGLGAAGGGVVVGVKDCTCCMRFLNASNSVCSRVCPTSGRELYSASLRENLPIILDCSARTGCAIYFLASHASREMLFSK